MLIWYTPIKPNTGWDLYLELNESISTPHQKAIIMEGEEAQLQVRIPLVELVILLVLLSISYPVSGLLVLFCLMHSVTGCL